MEAWEVERLVDEAGPDIYRFCFRLCKTRADAEDLYQQTFLKALEIELEVDWESNPKSLLFGIAYRLQKDKWRKFARRERLAPTVEMEEVADSSDMENAVMADALSRELQAAIAGLAEKFRVPVVLHYQFETPLEEVARIMGIPRGTVKSRLDKARKLLRASLEEKGYEGF